MIQSSFFRVILVAALMVTISDLKAQKEKEAQAIKAVVEDLFLAMKTGDSTLARKQFMPEVTSATIAMGKDGKVKLIRETSIDDFMKTIGTPHNEVYNEEIWNFKIEVDGNFGQAWCDYAFYIGDTFSHCGVDAFQLVKDDSGAWKIFHIADTRRKSDCIIPDEIKALHKGK